MQLLLLLSYLFMKMENNKLMMMMHFNVSIIIGMPCVLLIHGFCFPLVTRWNALK
jgi:hypothetical protein